MQSEAGSIFYDRCRCCLALGRHQNYLAVHIEMFRKCLNLILTQDTRISPMMCSSCASFLQDVQKFRNMVIASQKQLAELNKCNETLFSDALLDESQKDFIIDDSKVKVESENVEQNLVIGSNSVADVLADRTEETVLKTETGESPEYASDWETSFSRDGIQYEFKHESDDEKPKCKSKRVNADKMKHKRKMQEYDSESDTPISQIIKEKSRMKNKIEKEPKIHSSKSKHNSFRDNNKVRSNIVMILHHSTVLPFRNNFKSAFKCFYCDNLYIPFKDLKQHIETEHNNLAVTTISNIVKTLQNLIVTVDISCIKCRLCDEEFKSIENLVHHLCNIHNKTYYETDKKPSHGILGVDLSTDTPKCHICNKEFAFFKNLSVHMNEHYGLFVCYVCGKQFLSEHRYKCHIFKAHAEKDKKCKHCGKVFSTEPSMTYHIRKEHLKKMIKCLKCPETFSVGQYVKRLNHMAEAHGVKKPIFKCDTCGKQYANSGSLAAHKRYTHIRTKEHKCEICGYITVHNTVMKNHMDVHNGVKNYECEFCKKKFAKPYTLKLHLKIHLNDKRFVCSLCDAAFIQKISLKTHLKSRHPHSDVDINKL